MASSVAYYLEEIKVLFRLFLIFMLSVFPIQFLAPLAHFLLRIIAGVLLIHIGVRTIARHPRVATDMATSRVHSQLVYFVLGSIEILAGGFLFIGLYAQIAALITMVIALLHFMRKTRLLEEYLPSRAFFVLLFATSLSLCITGAGAFAFDLPI